MLKSAKMLERMKGNKISKRYNQMHGSKLECLQTISCGFPGIAGRKGDHTGYTIQA